MFVPKGQIMTPRQLTQAGDTGLPAGAVCTTARKPAQMGKPRMLVAKQEDRRRVPVVEVEDVRLGNRLQVLPDGRAEQRILRGVLGERMLGGNTVSGWLPGATGWNWRPRWPARCSRKTFRQG